MPDKNNPPNNSGTAFLRSLRRSLLLVALLLAATIDGRLRHALGLLHNGPEGAVWSHRWCRRIVRSLGLGCTVDGELPGRGRGFEAVVCNHLSYMDILLMSAARPFIMVAKSEVRRWPLLGWITAQAGTVYVDRGGRPETYPAVNAAMARAYRSGLPVLFFPEGTTTDGSETLPFRRGLFHSVLRDSVELRTAAIAYRLNPHDAHATLATHVCWWGDMRFTPHLFRLLGLRELRAAIRFGDTVSGPDRFILSGNARAAVVSIASGLSVDSHLPAGVHIAPHGHPHREPSLIQAH